MAASRRTCSCRTDAGDQRREVRGRLVEHDERRLEHQRAPHREHLALAAAELAGPPGEHRAPVAGTPSSTCSTRAGDLAGLEQVAAHLEVLADGERREHVVDLGHVADADPCHVLRRPAGDVALADQHAAPTGSRRARRSPFSSVLLPEPLGPTIDTTSPGSTAIDTPWSTGLAAVARDQLDRPQCDALHASHGPHRRRRALSRQGRPPPPRRWSAAPPSSPRRGRGPPPSRSTGSQNSSMIDSSCSTMTTVMPGLAERDQLHADLVRETRVDAGHRLVEQQHLGVGHQRPHDLDEPALAAAQVAGVAVGERRQAEALEHRRGAVDRLALLRPPVAPAEEARRGRSRRAGRGSRRSGSPSRSGA